MSETTEQPQPKKIDVKSIAMEIGLWLLAPGFGGAAQFLSEQPTAVVDGKDIEKFPEGIDFREEFLEGAIPVVAGMIVGKLFYRWSVNKGYVKPNKIAEKYCMITGGFLGYTSMMILGGIIHDITGVADVKLLPLK